MTCRWGASGRRVRRCCIASNAAAVAASSATAGLHSAATTRTKPSHRRSPCTAHLARRQSSATGPTHPQNTSARGKPCRASLRTDWSSRVTPAPSAATPSPATTQVLRELTGSREADRPPARPRVWDADSRRGEVTRWTSLSRLVRSRVNGLVERAPSAPGGHPPRPGVLPGRAQRMPHNAPL